MNHVHQSDIILHSQVNDNEVNFKQSFRRVLSNKPVLGTLSSSCIQYAQLLHPSCGDKHTHALKHVNINKKNRTSPRMKLSVYLKMYDNSLAPGFFDPLPGQRLSFINAERHAFSSGAIHCGRRLRILSHDKKQTSK